MKKKIIFLSILIMKEKKTASGGKGSNSKDVQAKQANIDAYSTYVNASEDQSQISDFETIRQDLHPAGKLDLKAKKYSVEPRISEHQEEEEIGINNSSGKKRTSPSNGLADTSDKKKGKKSNSVVDKILVKKDKKGGVSSDKKSKEEQEPKKVGNTLQEVLDEKPQAQKEEVAVNDLAAAELLDKPIQEEQSNAENDDRIYIIMKKEQTGGQIQGFLLSTPENEISILKEELGKFAREINQKTFQVKRKFNI